MDKIKKTGFPLVSVIVWCLMPFPFIKLLWGGLMQGGFDANPVEFVQLETGWAGGYLLLLVLYISPLRALFPGFSLLKNLARHKRLIGVSSFIYLMMHLSIYILDSGDIKTLMENLQRPFILSGSGAFLILLALAGTSWRRAIRVIGRDRWKLLHRFSYLAILLVFIHMMAKEKSNTLETLIYFLPLLVLQLNRYRLFVRKGG
ncbi:MAG: hypothetical protein GY786_15155 [Proteobacteria bacterium]|nr:hypothetical protein [Pseudomonadota bacterium]